MKKRFWIAAVIAAAALAGCAKEGAKIENTADGSAAAALETSETRKGPKETESPAGDTAEEKNGMTEPVEPMDAEVSVDFLSEWDGAEEIISTSSPGIQILTAGYEELQAVLDEHFQVSWEETKSFYEENLERAVSRYQENPESYAPSFLERSAVLSRCDNKIFSFLETDSRYLFGEEAHPSYRETGVNLSPASGEGLSLKDVSADYDGLFGALENCLEQEYGETLSAGWKETLRQMFYEDFSIDSCWTMDMEGLRFSFSPYLLSSFAAGTVRAEIPFSFYGGFVKREYIPEGDGFARRIFPDEPEILDGREILVTVSYDEEAYESVITVSCGEESASAAAYISFCEAYLMHTEQGKTYLYAEFAGDNDCRSLYVFDLNGGVSYVGQTQDAFLDHLVSDPENFSLYTRLDLLGTYCGGSRFCVGEDGMPKPLEDIYTIGSEWKAEGNYLTAKIPVPAWFQEGEECVRELLPAGTKFLHRRTDGETFVEMELEDGRRCQLRLEKEDYFSTIEGIPESEYFDGLHYAG